ncbi:MAG: ABC transporter ATP-binding protein [Bacteroidetes bacterium]|nr:ABC transporter ATP-binding protein [Bacteroidota bacterium]MBL6962458.1 ABC transporter ATP-binding protein [Bacteroidota bacterium]
MIKIQNLSKQYENASGIIQVVLEGIDLNIEQGESIAIVGPSGSGKSSLLNILGTLDRATSGSVLLNEKDLGQLSEKEYPGIRNTEIGFVFQQHHLLPQLSLLENILLAVLPLKSAKRTDEAKKRAEKLMEAVGLTDKTDQLPGQCSVGECQRVAVVRALINQPKVVLADEPTGSLDEQSANDLVNLLAELNREQKSTLIMVTHSMELAKKMKKIYRLSNKKLEQL